MKVFTPAGMSAYANAVAQLENCLLDDRARAGALMADHHLGYSMPIGGVIAYDSAISPSGVGYDIACGNKAVMTELTVDQLEPELRDVMHQIQAAIEFGVGRVQAIQVEHELFDDHAATLRELDQLAGRHGSLSQRARAQLGTVGSGNHYVDLLADEEGFVWVANHFGSRGLGHTIATGFLNLAAGKAFDERGKEREEPTVIPTDSELGQFYIAAMQLAGAYAYAGRDFVIDQVLDILRATPVITVHNHHNYAWLEDGLWVVRKGATPLRADENAFIGGSMGDGAVIVQGTGVDVGALGSAPHGAGRVMSRTKAAGKFKKVPVEREAPDGTKYTKKIRVRDATTGVVDWPAVRLELDARGIVVLGAAADEAPEVYKPLDDVLAAHENVKVVRRLRPLGVVMAGDDTFDPYKE